MVKTTTQKRAFHNPFAHGFVRVGAASPRVHLSRPEKNVEEIVAVAKEAHNGHYSLVTFPELSITGYTNDDLFLQATLLEATERAIASLAQQTADLSPVLLVGAPISVGGGLFNTAIVLHRGKILGVVPKSFLPNYREFYEKRYFLPASAAPVDEINLAGQTVPFGNDLLFCATDVPDVTLHVEICEDVWVPTPPSSFAALAGATVLANLSATNVTIGKSEQRHMLCRAQSQRCFAAYVFAASGAGESTTDLAWDGQAMVYENGDLLVESERFDPGPSLIGADVDIELLAQERRRHNSFFDAASQNPRRFRKIEFSLEPPIGKNIDLQRPVSRYPFVPSDAAKLDLLCYEAYNIQVEGLKQRLTATKIDKLVLGVSGGLDSLQALLVACRAFDQLDLPRQNILAYTLPAFATSDQTKSNAWATMRAVGVTANEIDLTAACEQMLKDIDHPAARGEADYDIAFENVQAGARTSLLFRLANKHNALVLGTGDLSEIALGWSTYGVGDQMSHYNVNGSVPKTLIQHLIRWVIKTEAFGSDAADAALAILNTDISPELIPGDASSNDVAQKTEEIIGPYALHDFSLYFAARYGLRPSKIAYLAHSAWGTLEQGTWPPNLSDHDKTAFDLATIKKWLLVFTKRFFETSQFKRSASPNGPKVVSGGSLSPRGDWRAPSDGSADIWLNDINDNVPEA